jgi:hypothetical protein
MDVPDGCAPLLGMILVAIVALVVGILVLM